MKLWIVGSANRWAVVGGFMMRVTEELSRFPRVWRTADDWPLPFSYWLGPVCIVEFLYFLLSGLGSIEQCKII